MIEIIRSSKKDVNNRYYLNKNEENRSMRKAKKNNRRGTKKRNINSIENSIQKYREYSGRKIL